MEKWKVKIGEIDKLVEILREVTIWGESHNWLVWKPEWLTCEQILQNAKIEEVCTGYVHDQCACGMLLQWNDPIYWPNAKPYDAGYIHKLCVKQDFGGQRLSEKLIEYAKEICKKNGVNTLRLDTLLDNQRLCDFYQERGFSPVGITKIYDGKNEVLIRLFEMQL